MARWPKHCDGRLRGDPGVSRFGPCPDQSARCCTARRYRRESGGFLVGAITGQRLCATSALVVIIGLLMAGCSAHEQSSAGPRDVTSTDRLVVATSASISLSSRADTGGLQGELLGARRGARACFWVDGPEGRAFIVVPRGWWADGQLQLLDSSDKVDARPGHPRLLAGAPGSAASPPGCPGQGRQWFTSSIRAPRPEYNKATLGPAKKN